MAKIWQEIFSVKNENEHKVFKFLGIKMKFFNPHKAYNLTLTNIKFLKDALKRELDNTKIELKNIKTELQQIKIEYQKQYCPICNSKTHQVIGKNPDFNDTIVVKCNNCGLMFNIGNNNSNSSYYEKEYRETRKEHISDKYLCYQERRANAQYNFITSNINESINNKIILEIGCSVGQFLNKFNNNGNILYGYEADIEMANFAQENINAKIYNEMCTLANLESNKYDLIALSHVFEHFEAPIYSLKELIRAVKPNGYIFIEIPNENENTVKFMCENQKGVGHFVYFNVNTFKKLIEKFDNVEIISIETFTQPIEQYHSNLVNKVKQNWDFNIPIKDYKGIHIRCLLRIKGN